MSHTRERCDIEQSTRLTLLSSQAEKVKQDELEVLRFGPGFLELKDLYLVELRRIGATIEPILGFVPAAEPDAITEGPSTIVCEYPANISTATASQTGVPYIFGVWSS